MADFHKEFSSKNSQKHMFYNRYNREWHGLILPSPSSCEEWPWRGFGTSLDWNQRPEPSWPTHLVSEFLQEMAGLGAHFRMALKTDKLSVKTSKSHTLVMQAPGLMSAQGGLGECGSWWVMSHVALFWLWVPSWLSFWGVTLNRAQGLWEKFLKWHTKYVKAHRK